MGSFLCHGVQTSWSSDSGSWSPFRCLLGQVSTAGLVSCGQGSHTITDLLQGPSSVTGELGAVFQLAWGLGITKIWVHRQTQF